MASRVQRSLHRSVHHTFFLSQSTPAQRPRKNRFVLGHILVAAGPRARRQPRRIGLGRHYLMERHPAAFEGEGAARHVDAPDAIALDAGQRNRWIARRLEPLHPAQQGLAIMRPQRFDIEDLKTLARHLRDYPRDVRQLAAGKDIAIDEAGTGWTLRTVVRITGGDAVIERDTARFEQPPDRAEIERQVGAPDMLVHADRDNLVEGFLAGDVAVILQPDLDALREPNLGNAAAGELVLPLAQGDADAGDAIALRRPDQQAAPAAADIEKPLARLELKLATDMVELLLLRRVDILRPGVEIGAGIDHLPVEPESVELIGHIVMMADRARIGGTAVAEAARGEHGAEPTQPGELADALGERDADGENVSEPAFDPEIATHVGGRQRVYIAAQQRRQERALGERDGDPRRHSELVGVAVPEDESERKPVLPEPSPQSPQNPITQPHRHLRLTNGKGARRVSERGVPPSPPSLMAAAPDCPAIPALLARLDLDVVPQVADANAVLQRAMTCLAATGEFSTGPATEADGPKAAALLHQIFQMRYGAHGFHPYVIDVREGENLPLSIRYTWRVGCS